MSFKKILTLGLLSVMILMGERNASFGTSNTLQHQVLRGETFWTISQKYGVNLEDVLELNNAKDNFFINIGDRIIIPNYITQPQISTYTVQDGDTYWNISQKFNVDFYYLLELNETDGKTFIVKGQQIKIPVNKTQSNRYKQVANETKPYITYTTYIVVKNDNIWSLANSFGIPVAEIFNANNINESTILYPGLKLRIPVHHIPIKSTPSEKFGEYLDWWTEVQYIVKRGSTFEVVDFYSGKSFFAKRTGGSNHADVEPLTMADTQKMKEIWGGNFSWERRPVLIKINGRKIAAGATAMPHAGNDAAPSGVWTSWRSGGYSAGTNWDWINGNGCDGHFDIHFLNSTRHKDGQIDARHQESIKISAGI